MLVGEGKWLSVGGISNCIVQVQSGLLNASFSRSAGRQQYLRQKNTRTKHWSWRLWCMKGVGDTGGIVLENLWMCYRSWRWLAFGTINKAELWYAASSQLPSSFSFPRSLFFLTLCLCFQGFLCSLSLPLYIYIYGTCYMVLLTTRFMIKHVIHKYWLNLLRVFYLFPFFLFSSISSDVSHGEHDREAWELWRSKTGCAAQFASPRSPTVQFPLTTTFPLRCHPPQGQGALLLQVRTLWCSESFPLLTMFTWLHAVCSRIHWLLNCPFLFLHIIFPPGTAGKSSLALQTWPDTCGHTQGNSPTGTLVQFSHHRCSHWWVSLRLLVCVASFSPQQRGYKTTVNTASISGWRAVLAHYVILWQV